MTVSTRQPFPETQKPKRITEMMTPPSKDGSSGDTPINPDSPNLPNFPPKTSAQTSPTRFSAQSSPTNGSISISPTRVAASFSPPKRRRAAVVTAVKKTPENLTPPVSLRQGGDNDPVTGSMPPLQLNRGGDDSLLKSTNAADNLLAKSGKARGEEDAISTLQSMRTGSVTSPTSIDILNSPPRSGASLSPTRRRRATVVTAVKKTPGKTTPPRDISPLVNSHCSGDLSGDTATVDTAETSRRSVTDASLVSAASISYVSATATSDVSTVETSLEFATTTSDASAEEVSVKTEDAAMDLTVADATVSAAADDPAGELEKSVEEIIKEALEAKDEGILDERQLSGRQLRVRFLVVCTVSIRPLVHPSVVYRFVFCVHALLY